MQIKGQRGYRSLLTGLAQLAREVLVGGKVGGTAGDWKSDVG